ncbi:MAG: protein tyrosine phosphatase family protein [Pseudomonadales bacterium]
MRKTILLLITILVQATAYASSAFEDISNYRQYSKAFSSSGQPSAAQLKRLSKSGVERVIYLAFTDDDSAIDHEDSIVKKLGMDYIHIPVDFMKPTLNDFQTFAQVMQHAPKKNTLVHCQVNFRASTFSMLYRTIFLGIPLGHAKEPFDSVWEPSPQWYQFIESVFRYYKVNMVCESCDWGANEFDE